MLEEPDEFGGIFVNDVVDALFHELDGVGILNGLRGYFPFGRGHGWIVSLSAEARPNPFDFRKLILST